MNTTMAESNANKFSSFASTADLRIGVFPSGTLERRKVPRREEPDAPYFVRLYVVVYAYPSIETSR